MKKTVIVGAVAKPYRYAYQVAEMLKSRGFPFVPLGIREGELFGETMRNINEEPGIEGVHTLTLYINEARQSTCEEYLMSLSPKRIIFNPGAENQAFKMRAEKAGIECIDACTLVMLSIGNY